MKRFLKQVFVFLISAFVLLTILVVFSNFLFKNDIGKYRVSANIHKIIIGDSHTQNGIDDSLLPNTKNFSHSSEAFMYSYFKLQSILQNNPSADTIFLAGGYHSFSVYFDDCFVNPEIASDYFFILPFKLQIELLQKSADRFKLLQYSFHKSIKNLKNKKEQTEFLGYYKPYFTTALISNSSVNERIKGQYYSGNELTSFSESAILYFKKIVALCKQKNKVLIVLNTPMNKRYREKVPAKFTDNFYSLIKQSGVRLFEFRNLNLGDSNFLPDGDHLSPSGSIIASKYLNDNLKSGTED